MDEQANSKNETQSRLSTLRELIREGEASTQDELCKALKAKKFDVTQSTVSRDLRRIGAIKTTNEEDEIIYVLPEDHRASVSRRNHDLTGLVTEVQANETMIILHTAPGSASLVATHLDGLRSSFEILGTIAGDDAIFIAPVSIKKIALVVRKIKEEYWLT